jgi:hypothetical protein
MPPTEKPASRLVIQLGRAGDVINILPLLYQEYLAKGVKQRLMVAKQYADILEGTSYIDPVIYDGDFADITGAIDYAKGLGVEYTTAQVVGISDVIVSQVYGNQHHPKIICDSFAKDSYKLLGKLDLWPSQPPLVFDRRDKKREKRLYKYIPTLKPWIVVSTGGISSPFPYRELLWEILNHCLPEFHIVDLAKIKAERMYDLLGIMDHRNTEAMILTDSGPLHLSCATIKPVHALIADSPTMWFGAPWRPSYASYTRYKNFPRDVTRILDVIRNPPLKPKHPNIIHVYQRTPWATGEEKRRNEVAAKTWDRIGCVDLGLDDNCFVRHAGNVIPNETKNIPMIKDMLRMACIGRDDKDVLVLTNTDTCVASNLLERLTGSLPVYAYRNDFKILDRPIADDQICLGNKYQGCDLFAMRVGWWRRNHSLFPDMVLGRHSWDRILRELFKIAEAREITNLIYHEKHPSAWEDASNLNNDPSNLRNAKLAREWLQERKMPLEELEFLNYEGRFKKPAKKR